MPFAVPCLDCGQLTPSSPCPRCRNRRNREKAQTSSAYYHSPGWERLRQTAIRRDGECVVCGSMYRLSVHHRKPRTRGGADSLDNLVTLCNPCHSSLEADVRGGRKSLTRSIVEVV